MTMLRNKPLGRLVRARCHPFCLSILSVLFVCEEALAVEVVSAPVDGSSHVEFDSSFLAPGSSRNVDISRFDRGNVVLPGNYSVDVFVNQNWVGRLQVPFKVGEEGANAQACFDKRLLEVMGVDLNKFAEQLREQLSVAGTCLPISQVISDATTQFDFAEQRLDVSIAQVGMSRSARGYVSPEHWDSGVTAAILGYDASTYRYGGNSSMTQNYVGLNTGVNIGEWRIRHDGSYSSSSSSSTNGKSEYQGILTYAQRDLTGLKSQLTLGDAYTTGELFDSTAFRGVRIATDDRMLPDSMRGYSPTVRGVASTNAKVTIKQNGVTVYETTVAPGAFEINDLYATGYGGDLDVSVLEADGRTSTFTVPYAAVPLSVRPGMNRFSVTAGQVRDSRLSTQPIFTQGTWQRGLTNTVTGYTGASLSQGYGAVLLGSALNTRFGAVGLDITQSQATQASGERMSGSSTRVSYSKLIDETATNFSIAAYRYSTGGYLSLNDAVQVRNEPKRHGGESPLTRQRSRTQVSISQMLGRDGSLYVSGSTVDYWNRSGTDVNYSLGYSNNVRSLGYSLSANRQRSASDASQTVYLLSLTLPFGGSRPMMATSNISRDNNGRATTQATLSGALFDDNSLSYGVTSGRQSGDGQQSTNNSAHAQYRSMNTELSVNAGSGTGYSQVGLGARGAIVAHPGGVTFSQPVSETIGIVEAHEASDARVLNSSGLKVDSRGYAVVPYLTPYSMNTVDLDPKGMSTDVELQISSQQVAPRAGAVVMLKYPTVSGRTAIIRALQSDRQPLPFGASVFNQQGQEVGVVGQGSKIFARGLEPKGSLIVKWEDGASSSCVLAYDLPERQKADKSSSYQQIEAICSASKVQE